MRKRNLTIGWGPKENCPYFVDLAFSVYEKDANPATLIITKHTAESVSNAGFQSALFVKPDPQLSFPYQVGEMFGFLGSFLAVLEAAEEEFVGIIFVNHLPRLVSGQQSTRGKESPGTIADGVERFCRLVSKSLTTGIHEFEPREYDWVYLNCEATVE